MKIGVSSYSFGYYARHSGASYNDLCDKAKEMGYDGIEFVDLHGDDIPAIAKAIRAHCAKIGLEVTAYTVGADFLKDDLQAEIARVKGCVDITELLGAKVMRHDACWGFKTPKSHQTYRDAIAVIAPAIREVTEYAAKKGIRTCTENHGFFIQEAYRLEELIRAVDHPNYGWLIDIGNFACADEDSVHAVAIAAPYAFHVHAKDFLIKSGRMIDPGEGWFKSRGGNYLRGTVIGHGEIQIPQCVALLKAAGYDGYLSVEFEGMEHNLEALKMAIAYLKRFV